MIGEIPASGCARTPREFCHFRNEAKGFAQGRVELAVRPSRVRYDEIQEATFLHGLLLVKQAMGVTRHVKDAYALFKVVLISGLVAFDLTQALALMLAPFDGQAVEHFSGDLAVELVHVHALYASLDAVVFGLKAPDGLCVLLGLIDVAGLQTLRDELEGGFADIQLLKQFGELCRQHLFLDVGLHGAISAITGAAVVDVFAFLHVAGQGAAAMAAANER